MLGWKTYSFGETPTRASSPNRNCRRFVARQDQARDRLLRLRISTPYLSVASCVSRLIQKPYIAGSAAIFYGFIKGYWIRMPRVNDKQLIKYLRTQQLRRLCGLDNNLEMTAVRDRDRN